MREDDHTRCSTGIIKDTAEQLDLSTVIGVLQAFSGETVREKLIDKLMRTAIAHGGAERCLLINPQGEHLRVDAEATVNGADVAVRVRGRDTPAEVALPESLIRHAICTREAVIIDDATTQNRFSADPSIVQGGVRSILSLPMITQEKLIGILHFENSLASGAFTPDRVMVSKLIASQAAISLENSRLYSDVADRDSKIRRLVDSNIIGILVGDVEGRLFEANDAFLRMLGYDRDDLASGRMRWNEMTPPEWRDHSARAVREMMKTGSTKPFEKEYFHKDGSRVPVLIGYATFDKHENTGIAFVLDLTERKRADEALRESEYKLRQIVEAVPGVIWSAAPTGRLTHVNRRLLDYSGMQFEEFMHRGWEQAYMHPADLPDATERYRRAIEAGAPYQVVLRLRRADGEFRWHRTFCEPLRDREGRIVQWYGLTIDVDETKKAEDDLRRSEAKFRDYAETASDWFWEIGPDYKFTLLIENAFVSDVYRIGTTCWEYALDLETEPEKWRDFWQTLEARKPFRDFVYHCAAGMNGSPMYVKASGKPIFDANGDFSGYRGTGTDVSALVRAEQERERLRQLESNLAHINRVSMMGELAASLSHEITQPIASARNNARAAQNFLNLTPPDISEVREALACIVGDADRAGAILERIREHVRKAPPRKEQFDLNVAINEVIVLAQTVTNTNGVLVRTRLADALLPVVGDRVQLQQVVLNLILNAAEAMGSDEASVRELWISTVQEEAGALVAVRDSGPGIDPMRLDRVFEAFYTTKSAGTGMGLSICESIIRTHGGKLWVEPNSPRGAVFQFTLPAA